MDALFGLPRRKSAGQSHRQPLHGSLFFKDQHEVDEHIAGAKGQKHDKVKTRSSMYIPYTCIYMLFFLAGHILRSSNRYKALDETAVFGCACRHEFPLMFINLKHGERCIIIISLHGSTFSSFPPNIIGSIP